MVEREGERGQGLAAASRHGQREHAGRLRGASQNMAIDLGPQRIDWCGRRAAQQSIHVALQPHTQLVQATMVAPHEGLAFGGGIESLGLQKIRIHQTGKQHPCHEGLGKTLQRADLPSLRRKYRFRRQGAGMGLPAAIGCLRYLQPGIEAIRIGKPGMVAGDHIGEHPAQPRRIGPACLLRSCCRMVRPAGVVAADVVLEGRRTFANVVQTPCHLGQPLPAENGCESAGLTGDGIEMASKRLPRDFRPVGQRMSKWPHHRPP